MSRDIHNLDSTVAAVASKLTGAGSVMTMFGWFTSSNFGMWAGILIGILGLVVNWYFKHRGDRRAEEAHKAYMKKLRSDSDFIPLGRHKADE